jgi:hypothetical protein
MQKMDQYHHFFDYIHLVNMLDIPKYILPHLLHLSEINSLTRIGALLNLTFLVPFGDNIISSSSFISGIPGFS